MAAWTSFVLTVPGKPILEAIGTVLETLLIFLDILEVILNTVKTLLVLFGNPLRALVEAIIALVNNLIQSLARTGLYAFYDIPDPTKDPSFKQNQGGFQNWVLRFKGSLLNIHDFQRPQPISGFLEGGFVLMVIDSPSLLSMVQLIKMLLRFFGRNYSYPRFLPPANVKVVPTDSKGDAILSVADAFSIPIGGLAVEWALPSTTPSADRGMGGFISNTKQEFDIPNWLIERSEIPFSQPIVIGNPLVDDPLYRDPTTAGPLVTNQVGNFVDPRTMQNVVRQVPITDEHNEPIIKFTHAYTLSPGSNPASFFLGQLGTFRYVDTNVKPDVTYFYRVRAYAGPLDVNTQTNVLNFKGPLKLNGTTGRYQLLWPSTNATQSIIVGNPSKVVRAKYAKIPSFDVMGNLRALFLTAFSLNFQIPLPPRTPIFGSNGKIEVDAQGNPQYTSLYDSGGNLLNPILNGLGSLTDQAGFVGGVQYTPTVTTPAQGTIHSSLTGLPTQMPWQQVPARYQAARLANKYGSLLLNNGSSMLEGFQTLMLGNLPAGAVSTQWPLTQSFNGHLGNYSSPTSISELVLSFTAVSFPTNPVGSAAYALAEISPTGTVDPRTMAGYASAFTEANVRKNVLAAVNYLKALAYGGYPPNWIQMSILRDLIPWSGQILYDILAKIQALLDAFSGVFQEIVAFINLIERKIAALEQFIEYLIGIIDFLESLYIGCYLLSVSYLDGDITSWFNALDTATGGPTSGPGGYTCGVCFAYLAPNIGPLAKAFSIIF